MAPIRKENAIGDPKQIMALFHLLLLIFISSCTAQSPGPAVGPTGEFCNDNAKINGSEVSANIDNVLAQLVSDITKDGFSIASSGNAGDQVYGLAQCRGDVSSEDCSSCIQDASKEIRKRCPNQADARIWYDYCFLRYSTQKFYGRIDTSFGIIYLNVANVTDPDSFNKQLGPLIDKIMSEAVMPGQRNFATGKSKLSPFVTLYALVQCTRDLSKLPCSQCLAIAIGNFPKFCSNKQGCQVLYSTCYVRYEIYPFFFPLDPQETLANPGKTEKYSSVVFKP